MTTMDLYSYGGKTRQQELEDALGEVVDLLDGEKLILNPSLDPEDQEVVSAILTRVEAVYVMNDLEEGE
jgi:hypothetical protein